MLTALRQRTQICDVLCALAIFVGSIFVYQSNGDTYLYSYDSAPNSLLVFNALDYHRLDFENFRGGYLDSLGASYIFVQSRQGRLVSQFPIGAAILTAPLYVAFDVERRLLHQPLDITQAIFERYRLHYEKQAATTIAALSAVLIFLCSRRLGATLVNSSIVTLFFAFGTEMWVIGSQALWQHGSVNLVLLATIYTLLAATDSQRKADSDRWLFLAGICAGFVPVVRPTAALFLVAGLAFVVLSFRTRCWVFACGALLGVAPGVAWNWHFFHSIIGAYVDNTHNYVYSLSFASQALLGLLLNPSKGLAITTPLVVFSVAGAVRASRMKAPAPRLVLAMAAAGVTLILTYAFYVDWWGGTNFGDRFVSDTAAVMAILLVFVLPKDAAFFRTGPKAVFITGVFSLLFLMSVGVQFVGANGEMESEWSSLPDDIDSDSDRLWSWQDTQVGRDALATYHKFAPNVTLLPSYQQGFNVHVIALDASGVEKSSGLTASANEQLPIIASVANRGTSQLYGYTTGEWIGQTRIRVEIRNLDGILQSSGTLYLSRRCAPSAIATMTGRISMPAIPGFYRIAAYAFVNRIDDPAALARTPPLQVSLRIR